MTTINDGLVRQFTSSWKMLRQAIEKVPDDHWFKGTKNWVFARGVFHIIQTADFYLQNTPEGFDWKKRLGNLDWETSDPEAFPSKDEQLTYLNEIETQISSVLQTMKDVELLDKDGFHWFNSILEKFIYLLRHNMHHIGELGQMLREWEFDKIKWE